MKKNVAIVLLLALIVYCASIVYKNFGPPEDDGYRSSKERALIKKFDKDGDGELSQAERKAVSKAEADRKKAFMKKFDKDGDGQLSKEEAASAKRDRGR